MEKDYVERDVSWMYFNRRILLEAEKEEVPLLERLGFLGIYSNNLDEFFRVRVATLNRIIEYEDKGIKREQQTAVDTYREITRLNAQYSVRFEEIFARLKEELRTARYLAAGRDAVERSAAPVYLFPLRYPAQRFYESVVRLLFPSGSTTSPTMRYTSPSGSVRRRARLRMSMRLSSCPYRSSGVSCACPTTERESA